MTSTHMEPAGSRSVATANAGRRRLPGVLLAGMTAVISGMAVFVNSYGVHAVRDPAVYTTAKNATAALILVAGLGVLRARRRRVTAGAPPSNWLGDRSLTVGSLGHWLSLVYVGVVGGGVAFVLFFVGLAHTSAEPAAFLHDTLVVWVAVLALPFLSERLSPWNIAAVVLLVAGQTAVVGGVGHLVVGQGQLLVLAATLLWAVETVLAKRLLSTVTPSALGTFRMAVGAVVLVGYVAATGHAGNLVDLDGKQLGWVLLTGVLLAGYVASWMLALARARAVDVTSVLAASVILTAL
ncbi:MAG TPA: EamA family transporter, partial [Acidimicrobiales bacterium]|nr:EamA family transporter [Acidimicrobiales bacterium]